MKLYTSFLIRCWLIRDEKEERLVLDIEHIQRGDHLRAVTPDEAINWIMAVTRSEREIYDQEIILDNSIPTGE